MNKIERLRVLLTMAAADNGITVEELRLLGSRAIEWGITDDEFEGILNEAIAGNTTISLPEEEGKRWEMLIELIRMMAADGKLHRAEKELFSCLAARMEISPDRLDEAINAAIAEGPC